MARAFGLDSGTRECLAESSERAVFKDHGRYIHVTTYAPDEREEGALFALECVVGENWRRPDRPRRAPTNEIMKVLTLTSLILLPGALIAGVMGMNFNVGLFDQAELFWVVLAAIILIAPITIALAKTRRWI